MEEKQNELGKLFKPSENILAYLEHRKLLRDAATLDCNHDLVEKVISNYIIVKNIISHLVWQEQCLCKLVNQMWRGAVNRLQEQHIPNDFVWLQKSRMRLIMHERSHNFSVEPLAIFVFMNDAAFMETFECQLISASPCPPGCKESHNLLDMVYNLMCYPKKCMLATKSEYLSYMPAPESKTYRYTFKKPKLGKKIHPVVCGLYIPKLPNVKLDFLNVSHPKDELLQDFKNSVSKICESGVIKAVLVFVTDKYLVSNEMDLMFLKEIGEIQKDVPFAFGGCIVDDAFHNPKDLPTIVKEKGPFVTEDVVSIAVFSVDKDASLCDNTSYTPLDAYSLVIDATDWNRARIQKTINEFSEKVPRFEHSVALKLSCVGRDNRHELEQDAFRAAFPRTPLAGCYGNGEIGHDHPARAAAAAAAAADSGIAKRLKKDDDCQGLFYSYSTVFVYFGWGRVVS